PESLVLDTVITKNKFLYILTPGKYQWRVMAQNSSSHTEYSAPHSFEIANAVGYRSSKSLNSPSIAPSIKQYLQRHNSTSVYKSAFVMADNSIGNIICRPSEIFNAAQCQPGAAQRLILR